MDINQLIQMIQSEYQKGNSEKALKFSRILSSKLADKPNAVYHYAICLFYEGRILVDKGDLKESEEVLGKCIKIYENGGKVNNGYYLMASLALADSQFKGYKNNEAKALYERVLGSELYKDEVGIKTKIYHKYAVISERNRKYEDAINWYEKYLDSFSKMHSDKAPNFVEFYRYKEKLKLALKAKKSDYKGDFVNEMGLIQASFPNGDSTIMDIKFARYLVSELPDPSNKDIKELITSATYLEFKDKDSKKGVKITDENRRDLISCLQVEEIEAGHQMKIPDKTLILLDNNSNELNRIEYFEEGVIRIQSKWKPDAALIDKERLINWINQN